MIFNASATVMVAFSSRSDGEGTVAALEFVIA
jgi:hypothetical protein